MADFGVRDKGQLKTLWSRVGDMFSIIVQVEPLSYERVGFVILISRMLFSRNGQLYNENCTRAWHVYLTNHDHALLYN
jgi:hypothetical protein